MLNESFEYIKNWRKATVADLETDNLLEDVTKIHILGYQLDGGSVRYLWGDTEESRIKAFLTHHIKNDIPIVMHNGISFDKRVWQKLYKMDLSKLQIIDTLWLSYYLNTDKQMHSIAALAKDYDVGAKFEVDNGDWQSLTREQAVSRVVSDVEINKEIWEDFKVRLEFTHKQAKHLLDSQMVGGKRIDNEERIWIDGLSRLTLDEYIGRTIGYLCAVSEVVAKQEDTGWEIDQPHLKEHLEKLEGLAEISKDKLESVMPSIPDYRARKQPAKPYRKNGELSVSGANWERLVKCYKDKEVDEKGTPITRVVKQGEIEELVGYTQPNINSSDQIKDFLFSKGWNPQTIKFVRDQVAFTAWIESRPKEGAAHYEWSAWKDSKPEERQIPQIKKDGELCPSIEELAGEVPEVSVLEEYSVIVHRIGVLRGMLESMNKQGKVKAGAHGLASSLRLQHRKPITNLPAANKLHAEGIRGSLIAGKGKVLLGSDLSSLEDRVKVGLMMPHDPELAEEMSKPTFCPHITQAVAMGTLTKEQGDGYVNETLSPEERKVVSGIRGDAKPVVYLSAYGGTYKALVRQTGWPEQRCKDAIEAYWETNWSLNAIADEQVIVQDAKGGSWIVHPLNGLLVSLRSEKDRFNAVAQSAGSFFHFNWIFNVLKLQEDKWGKSTITANVHDELILCFKDTEEYREIFTDIVNKGLQKVNETYKMRRSLDCDIQMDYRYSDIH